MVAFWLNIPVFYAIMLKTGEGVSMPIIMEAEVPGIFISCFTFVFLCKTCLGTGLLLRNRRPLIPVWIGYLVCELLSFYFLCSFMFRGRLSYIFEGNPGLPSIDNSVCIGLFGVCWAVSVFLLLYILHRAIRKK